MKLSIAKLQQRQNIQLGRIFRVKNPLIDVIYVTQQAMNPEILRYYYKVLELHGVSNPQQRVTFITPENQVHFPDHFSLTSMLLYSPHCL